MKNERIFCTRYGFIRCWYRNGAEGVSRNPDAAGKIRSIMVLGIAMAETTGIYALVIALILIFMKG